MEINNNMSKYILRDLYLRDIHLGKIQGPLQNNIYKDKPWVKNYVENEMAIFNPCDTFYNTYKNFALKHLDEQAVFVCETNKMYTHREILQLVDKASAGFAKLGIKNGDKVGIMLNGSIEEVINFFALSKVGAVSKYIDYMKAVPQMKHNVEEDDLVLLVMDECFMPLNPIINEKNIPLVIANSKNKYEQATMYEELYQTKENIDAALYQKDKVTLIINSSGTTGPAKPISHTDFSVHTAVQKMLFAGYPLGPGNVVTKNIPSQIGLGLITLYTSILSGSILASIGGNGTPDLSNKLDRFIIEFPQFKEKYHLNENALLNVFTACIFVRLMMKDERIHDMSYVGSILGAGSKMDKEELDAFDEITKAKGYNGNIYNGYGQNEMAGAVTLNTPNHNQNGSAGYPTIGTNIVFVNQENKNTIDYGHEGLLYEQTDSKFLRYENLPEKTKEAQTFLSDGSLWYDTKDIAYMDQNGFNYITGRTTRVATREDFKFSLDDVEAKIRALPYIKDCAIILTAAGKSFEEFALFYVPTTYEYANENTVAELIKNEKSISNLEIPDEYLCMETIPYLNGVKIDYQSLNHYYKEFMGQTRKRKLEK